MLHEQQFDLAAAAADTTEPSNSTNHATPSAVAPAAVASAAVAPAAMAPAAVAPATAVAPRSIAEQPPVARCDVSSESSSRNVAAAPSPSRAQRLAQNRAKVRQLINKRRQQQQQQRIAQITPTAQIPSQKYVQPTSQQIFRKNSQQKQQDISNNRPKMQRKEPPLPPPPQKRKFKPSCSLTSQKRRKLNSSSGEATEKGTPCDGASTGGGSIADGCNGRIIGSLKPCPMSPDAVTSAKDNKARVVVSKTISPRTISATVARVDSDALSTSDVTTISDVNSHCSRDSHDRKSLSSKRWRRNSMTSSQRTATASDVSSSRDVTTQAATLNAHWTSERTCNPHDIYQCSVDGCGFSSDDQNQFIAHCRTDHAAMNTLSCRCY